MTTEEFISIRQNWELKQYIVDIAKQVARTKTLQAECIRAAWLGIMLYPHGGKTTELYANVARKCMRHRYINDPFSERWRPKNFRSLEGWYNFNVAMNIRQPLRKTPVSRNVYI